MIDPAAKARHAASFGAAATTYERGRPSYPPDAVAWLLPDGARRVVDLGAGTGKLTRDLLGRGLDVVAVEPSDGMRAELARVLPDARTVAGRGESLPLEDGSVDAVLAAQAWHWVDPARAVPEVARVLRPGGRLGLMWNRRDETRGWLAELSAIIHRHGFVEDRSEAPPVGPPFGPVERRDFPFTQTLTPDALVDLVASRSYFLVRPAAEQAAILADVRALIARRFGDAREIVVPYVTRCSRADLT